ncbi:MAG: 23S rRNA (adenine(2503)-C(2))-methyltransferase RlmN [Oligoflexia bacterium]|nr:23S rRNA (adenine(2503)-C(2))-methyltransferase RlmN [Oligoflexia bacterium]
MLYSEYNPQNNSVLPNFYGLIYSEVEDYLLQHSFSKYVVIQLFNWVYKKQLREHDKWSNISKKLRVQLKIDFDFSLPQIIETRHSCDGTIKFLLQMKDNEKVEAVLIPSEDRLTLCISTQVGCAMRCTFCFTGTKGFIRNLKCHEIVGEYLAINEWYNQYAQETGRLPGGPTQTLITNIVYMGQGEPLNNFQEVKRATLLLLDPQGIAFGQRKITLSTVGIIPMLLKMGEFPPINIAISLHSPRDHVRDQLIPINRTFPLAQLFAAIEKIPLKAHRRITYEYLLIEGLTNTAEDLVALKKLISPERSKINLIPYNEFPGATYKRPTDEKVLQFCNQLGEMGYTCTVRRSKGSDILAACGQLRG